MLAAKTSAMHVLVHGMWEQSLADGSPEGTPDAQQPKFRVDESLGSWHVFCYEVALRTPPGVQTRADVELLAANGALRARAASVSGGVQPRGGDEMLARQVAREHVVRGAFHTR